MVSGIPVKEDTDLERLYAQARRYDLLSREQEREIDERKWGAIQRLLELLVEDPYCRHYLIRWTGSCSKPLPDIEKFKPRKHRSLLRRELTNYLPGGTSAHKITALAKQFTKPDAGGELLSCLLELSLPTSLVVGMAEAVMHRDCKKHGSKVAAALQAWEHHWPPEYADVTAPGTATKKSLMAQINGYTSARDLLVMHNLRLVYTIAGRNRNRGAAFLDLVQEGNLGLLRAAEKFQFERGYRFSTYAFNWITQGVKRHLADAAGTIRYPTHIKEQLGKVHGERGKLLARTGRAPGDTELAGTLDLTVEKTRELLQLRNFGVSLETPKFDDDTGATLLDALPGGPFANPGDETDQASLNHRLLREIRQLDTAEQQVVVQRWGLHPGPALTRAEIADKMSISSEWVRQLEQSALNKLGQNATVQAVYNDHYPGQKHSNDKPREAC
ncbi:MAG: RNA polymerase sigma factor (sigma-70 family) [Halioglobus sp.]|jgi:RNA polymerase sigma factor (sigma-70 family)